MNDEICQSTSEEILNNAPNSLPSPKSPLNIDKDAIISCQIPVQDQDETTICASATSTAAPSSDSLKKWSCEYCTYENFPLSLKCTMCRAVKPLVNEDIYRLKDADENCSEQNSPKDFITINENDTKQHQKQDISVESYSWNCEHCGCSNPNRRPASLICRQCGTYKSKDPIDKIQEHIDSLSLNQEPDHCAVPNSSFQTSSPLFSQSSSVNKWPCHACTFENWPKTVKCAMCGTLKSVSQTPNAISPSHNHPPLERSNLIMDYDIHDFKASTKLPSRAQYGINDVCSKKSPIRDLESGNNRRVKRNRQIDWAWLQACLGVVDGDIVPVVKYLSYGGDPARQITSAEVTLLNRAAFDAGYTLIHLAIRFQREDILKTLLSRISGGGPGIKRAPSYVAPDLAGAIRRHVASNIRHKKGFSARYLHDITTFCLPADMEELPPPIQEQLYEELLDRDAQQQLEGDAAVINWSLELTMRLGSRLYALWNRSAGDCLLDAVLQATWGVFDRDNTLRRALSETLQYGGRTMYPRWLAQEIFLADKNGYTPDECQLEADWSCALHAAAQPGRSLSQLHVWALSHVVRRPIIVYAYEVVNSFRGEALGYACFQGVYIPMLWDPSFCSKSPICLGYTRGHFSALVPIEPYSQSAGNTAGYLCRSENEPEEDDVGQDEIFLPLTDSEGKLLPVHFLTCEELGHEESILQQWMLTCSTGGGLLVARQRTHQRPLLVAQMLEEWLNHYRRIAQQTSGPFPPRLTTQVHEFSSDGDSDEE